MSTQTVQSGPYVEFCIDDDVIVLGTGNPDPSLLPTKAVADALQRHLSDGDPTKLQYHPAGGFVGCRQMLSQFLTRHYHFDVPPAEVFLNSGCSAGLGLVVEAFVPFESGTIFCENPTFFLTPAILRSAMRRADAIAAHLPVDRFGLRIDALERALAEARAPPALVYIIPAFHNPAAVTLSTRRRCQLVLLARRHNFVIAADEPYQLLAFDAAAPLPRAMRFFDALSDEQLRALAAQCVDGDEAAAAALVAAAVPPPTDAPTAPPPHVVGLGSFSKLIGPGLRMGWFHAHPALLRRLAGHGVIDSGGNMNPLGVYAVHELIRSGELERNIARLCAVYASRARALTAALREHLGAVVSFEEPRGGFFVWARFPEWVDVADMLKTPVPAAGAPQITTTRCCKQRGWGVTVRTGAACSTTGADFRNCARLCFAMYNEEELAVGTRRLAALFREYARVAGHA